MGTKNGREGCIWFDENEADVEVVDYGDEANVVDWVMDKLLANSGIVGNRKQETVLV